MSSHRRRARRGRRSRSGASAPTVELDRFTLAAIRKGKDYARRATRYQWDYYAALAQQRAERSDEIKKSLLVAAEGPLSFDGWRRVVDYRYSLNPLSAAGSIATDPGGRFNIGDLDRARFSPFAALYLASEASTAIVEKFGPNDEETSLSNLDLALRSGRSYSCVSVSGRLDAVIDIRHSERLQPLIEVIKKFRLPKDLAWRARDLGFAPPNIVRSADELLKIIMAAEWRIQPMQFDIPAAPQIFGQLVWGAGIEGIAYPSVKSGATCLAVFPENLASSSFVTLDHQPPPGVVNYRVDGTNYRNFI